MVNCPKCNGTHIDAKARLASWKPGALADDVTLYVAVDWTCQTCGHAWTTEADQPDDTPTAAQLDEAGYGLDDL